MKKANFSRTKIVATLGPACEDDAILESMIKAGVNIARLNFSHGSHEVHQENLERVRRINKKLETNVGILQDLQGPKIRVGMLKNPIKIKPGDVLTFRSDTTEHTKDVVPIQYPSFAKDVKVGHRVLADDGNVEFVVVETDKRHMVKMEVKYGNVLKSKKGVNLPETTISINTITQKDFEDIEFAIKNEVEWLALSFVRNSQDILTLKEFIRLKGGKSRIIAKIEKPEAVDDIDNIIRESDAIMVARGDLGVEVPMEDVPTIQKRIIQKCNRAGKPVIVATQVMESMIENHRPTRAEASDVANAVDDGADAVMLSGETSVGKHPIIVIESMKKIMLKVEEESKAIFHQHDGMAGTEEHPASRALIISACKMSENLRGKAIVGMTRSGYTAFEISRCRPKAHIYIFTGNKQLLTTLSLVWGVRAIYYDKPTGNYETIQNVNHILLEHGFVAYDDVVINTASMPLHTQGLTNMMKVSYIGE
ncbi:MAG: pyruvate kinase [Bacteroidia bacterium]